jgi:hypothetical protein
VFSLGVVLFELLTGTLPEGELRPSAKVMAQGAAAQELADQCATSLDTLLATLSGTLDPVVQRALEPDATRRYASMEQFAATIERVLEGRAV